MLRTHEIRGTKEQIVEQIRRLQGEVLLAVVTLQGASVGENEPNETTLLSEAALSEDWDRPEEDAAWLNLPRER